MDIQQASGIVRAMHAQYNKEKAALAFLDEALTAMADGESTYQQLHAKKIALEQDVLVLHERLALEEEAHQARLSVQQQALADFTTEANAQRSKLQAQVDAQVASLSQHGMSLANMESASQARLSGLHDEIVQAQQQKQVLAQQIEGLQAQLQAIRQAVAGVGV